MFPFIDTFVARASQGGLTGRLSERLLGAVVVDNGALLDIRSKAAPELVGGFALAAVPSSGGLAYRSTANDAGALAGYTEIPDEFTLLAIAAPRFWASGATHSNTICGFSNTKNNSAFGGDGCAVLGCFVNDYGPHATSAALTYEDGSTSLHKLPSGSVTDTSSWLVAASVRPSSLQLYAHNLLSGERSSRAFALTKPLKRVAQPLQYFGFLPNYPAASYGRPCPQGIFFQAGLGIALDARELSFFGDDIQRMLPISPQKIYSLPSGPITLSTPRFLHVTSSGFGVELDLS